MELRQPGAFGDTSSALPLMMTIHALGSAELDPYLKKELH
jgi:hypothetical protein